jgi:hypothetical protein
LPVGITLRITLELASEAIRLNARIVSCEPSKLETEGPSVRRFETALAFVRPTAGTSRALRRIVQHAASR